ncbi:ATP-binding protein [Streptomyces sp. NPDC057011]|uniref:ATP-binding protein n=1 Tax=unclassified Streptomyces TaxID=2593676 RepID=UPI0036337F5F
MTTAASARPGPAAFEAPHHKTLDDYDFSFQPELDPRKVKDLATLSFVETKANAALLGPPRVGKTHIAAALAVAACRAGYSIYFTVPRRHGTQPHRRRIRRAPDQQTRQLPQHPVAGARRGLVGGF